MRLPKWNDIPFDSNEDPEVKALEFDLQYEENKSDEPDRSNPYSKENFDG